MGTVAPAAIRALAEDIEARVKTNPPYGIVGDASHLYGYHLARDVLPASDYSVAEYSADRAGPGDAASALDVRYVDMSTVTRRLLDAARAGDPRMKAVREFYGTLDGVNVTGWDLPSGSWATSDDSHLWHVHLSFFREYANDVDALMPIADVIAGTNQSATEDDDVADIEKISGDAAKAIGDAVVRSLNGGVQDAGAQGGTLAGLLRSIESQSKETNRLLAALAAKK